MNVETNADYELWNAKFADEEYFYGHEPSPLARRAVRYHRALHPSVGRALDVGSGEGQDVLFFAQSGYHASGVDLTQRGIEKARRLMQSHDLSAQLWQRDLLQKDWTRDLGTFDLVQSINCLQFCGEDGPQIWKQMLDLVALDGVVGLSVFARENGEAIDDELWLPTRDEVLAFLPDKKWQPLEVAQLWQWGLPQAGGSSPARMFVTVIARRTN